MHPLTLSLILMITSPFLSMMTFAANECDQCDRVTDCPDEGFGPRPFKCGSCCFNWKNEESHKKFNKDKAESDKKFAEDTKKMDEDFEKTKKEHETIFTTWVIIIIVLGVGIPLCIGIAICVVMSQARSRRGYRVGQPYVAAQQPYVPATATPAYGGQSPSDGLYETY